MLKTKKLFLPLIIGMLLGSQQIFAASTSIQNFRLRPVGDLWGFAGKGEIAQGQLILPFIGDINSLWFGDAEGKFGTSNNDWFLGAAAGYRKVINDRILGGYLALNYNKTRSGLHAWIANPGIESLGTIWDFRVNGYFPISTPNRNVTSTNTGWANESNVYDYVRFTGHTMYNRQLTDIYKTDEQMGRGFDAEVGRTIPFIKNLKFYLGGYHFDTKSIGSINGVATRLTYQLNDYVGLEAKYNYDNYKHNVALLGIKFTINGMNSAEKNTFGISARLLDNIEHNFGSISTGTAVPVKKQIQYERIINPIEQIQKPNVWFVRPGATNNGHAGTYEDPLVGFDETVLADIEKTIDPVILLAPGTYHLNIPTGGLQFNDGIEIDGKAADFIHPDILNGIADVDVIFKTSGLIKLGANNVISGLDIQAETNTNPSHENADNELQAARWDIIDSNNINLLTVENTNYVQIKNSKIKKVKIVRSGTESPFSTIYLKNCIIGKEPTSTENSLYIYDSRVNISNSTVYPELLIKYENYFIWNWKYAEIHILNSSIEGRDITDRFITAPDIRGTEVVIYKAKDL